jgi:dTDP-4-amino-4,6-dideoxygalactose transaminase
MQVPLLDLKTQHQALEPELLAAFQRILSSSQFILGAEVESFERAIAGWIGVGHAIGVSSGTDAILLALMSLGVGPGDEVICPSFTFFATAGSIVRAGATPVFADCCPVCFNLDPVDAARRVTPKTKAIIPVHLFGQTAAMDQILSLAQERNLFVIEDAAQALGAACRGRKAGAVGDFGTFSFFPSKNLGALGDAGLLVTNNDQLAERARLLRTHGARQKYYHQFVGANFRLDAVQAAWLKVKLPHCESYSARRSSNAAFYTASLSGLAGVVSAESLPSACLDRPGEAQKSGRPSLILPVSYSHNTHIWNQYTLRVPGQGQRDALRQFLAGRGIGSEIYYPLPLHQQECFAFLGCRDQCLPVSEEVARECLSIPVFPELTSPQLESVVSAIGDFLQAWEGA